MEASKKKSPSPIAWVLGQAGPHGGQFALSVILAVLGVAFSVAPYFAVVGIVKGLMAGERNLSYYLIQAGLIALMWLGRVLCHAFSTATSHRATFAVLGEIRKRCTEKLTRMPLGAVLSQSSGALKNTLIERIDSIETTLAHIVPEFTANLLIPVIITVYIFTIDWRMGLASLATVPLGMFFYIWMMATSAGFYQATIDNTKALNNTAVEYINGIQVIKVFGKTKSSYERFVKDAHAAAGAFIGWMRASIIPFTFAMVVMPATMVSVLPIGGLLVKGGTLSGQDFITVIILSVGLITPLITLMSYSDDIRTMGTIFGEVQAILDAPEQERPATGDAPKGNDLKLEDVHFSYAEVVAKAATSGEDSAKGDPAAVKPLTVEDREGPRDKEILHGVSMAVPEGSFVALVGSLGGKDIRQITQEAYADRVAFVSQDNYLFNMTVRENIRLGRPGATDAEVEAAARNSGCHEFILGLEHGYDTLVGSSGGHLSGGERQRISIARAMLKAAPIVILDEATAYTDPENEAVIQRSVSKLTAGKTLIVIAHRLSTVTDADRIYVVNDGNIEDSGTHEELLSHHGLYEKMWKAHMEVKDNG